MAEQTTFVGDTTNTGVNWRTTYQLLTTKQKFASEFGWAAFNKTPLLKAFGLEAFGVQAVQDVQAFGVSMARAATGSQDGKLIRFDQGVHSVSGAVMETTGSSTFVGRLGSFTPELVEGGDSWVYAWHRLIASRFIPDVDVQDNGPDRYIDIKAHKVGEMKQVIVRDFNLAILGNAAAPQIGVLGPSSVNNDLPNLISVTQTANVGSIAKSAGAYWQNQAKAIANLGGGGEMDRPITMRRSMMKGMNDAQIFAESTGVYLYVATQGAWQFYDRLMYADSVQAANAQVFGGKSDYDAAGIDHFVFRKRPMVWEPALTIPVGATASTEAIYAIHLPTFAISLRSEEAFLQTPWEDPRTHDTQRTLNAQNRTRMTPMVTGMRSHVVFYDLPANND